MNYQSVLFNSRAITGRQAAGPVRINPRYVVSTTPYRKADDQTTDTAILLSTGDTVVVEAPPSRVDSMLKGGSS